MVKQFLARFFVFVFSMSLAWMPEGQAGIKLYPPEDDESGPPHKRMRQATSPVYSHGDMQQDGTDLHITASTMVAFRSPAVDWRQALNDMEEQSQQLPPFPNFNPLAQSIDIREELRILMQSQREWEARLQQIEREEQAIMATRQILGLLN